MEAAARAYWQVWFSTYQPSGCGLFVTTPRAEDIVIRGDPAVCVEGKIVDLDTLRAGISKKDAFELFARYPYYPQAMITRIFEDLARQHVAPHAKADLH
jgi:hypothetical protein